MLKYQPRNMFRLDQDNDREKIEFFHEKLTE